MGEPTSLAALEASFEREARLDQSFVVLTVAASSLYAWLRHAEPRASHRTTQGEVQSGS